MLFHLAIFLVAKLRIVIVYLLKFLCKFEEGDANHQGNTYPVSLT